MIINNRAVEYFPDVMGNHDWSKVGGVHRSYLNSSYSALDFFWITHSGVESSSLITGDVIEYGDDAKSLGWKHTGLQVTKGQTITISGRMYHSLSRIYTSYSPSISLSESPSASISPSISPSPSVSSSLSPSMSYSNSSSPSISPSISRSQSPSGSISPSPTVSQSISPSKSPSKSPSISPSISPSQSESASTSMSPSISPSESKSSSLSPSVSPSESQSSSISPSISPSPSVSQSISPSISPSESTSTSISPSISPSTSPSSSISPSASHPPSYSPSNSPSISPSPSASASVSPDSSHYDNGPISFYLVDDSSGAWISAERMLFVDDSYGQYQTTIVVNETSANATLYVSCGNNLGTYEFQKIRVTVSTPTVAPVTGIYLYQLLPRMVIAGHLYSTFWVWEAATGSEGYIVRLASTSEDIENNTNLLLTETLESTQLTYQYDIGTPYDGVYLSVVSIVGGVESTPLITWYLPGQLWNTADEVIPPLRFQATVTAEEVADAYLGYITLRRTPPPTPGYPAVSDERMDVDQNGYAGRVADYNLIRGQYLGRKGME
jgi:hypothetical protein